jgi:hypothetical protein
MYATGKTLFRAASIFLLTLLSAFLLQGQISGPPTANCHITDGTFSTCPNGMMEWSDVTPLAFPATNSFLYVNQDSAHSFLYLMYDFPFRTAQLGPNDSVHVSFDTVSQDSGTPGLEEYDIFIYGNGQMQVLEQGQPTPAGRIVGAGGFGVSPNSSTPHVMAELQVPLTPGPPTDYSPDPLFWSASLPPTPPPPPDPPSCPVTIFGLCIKSQDQIDAWTQEADAAYEQAESDYTNGQIACDNLGQQAQQQADQLAQAAVSTAANQLNAQLQLINSAFESATEFLQEHLENPNEPMEILEILENIKPTIVGLGNAVGDATLTLSEVIEDPGDYFVFNVTAYALTLQAVGKALSAVDAAEAAGAAVSAFAAEELAPLAGFMAAGVLAYDDALLLNADLALAIQAVAQDAATAACLAALDVTTAPEFAKAAYFELLAEDPPDPNYTVIAQPVTPTLPGQPITVASGFSQQVVNDLNALVQNLENELALLQVIPTSVNRVAGAVAAGSQVWQRAQAQAVQQYASELIPLLNNEPSLRATLAQDLTASGLRFTFNAASVANLMGLSAQNGLPSGLATALTQLGLGAAAQQAIIQSLSSIDPSTVAALGTGNFPQALVDPSLSAAIAAASNALGTLAATQPTSALAPSFTLTLPGDYVSAGVGLRSQTGGTITIAGIPTGATVQKALLYWGMLDNGEDASLHQLNFNGTALSGTRIGTGPDTCWGRTNSFTYRADVTSYVTGNGAYVLTGVAIGGNILAEGASLVVVYQLAGAPFKTIIIDDGNIAIPLGSASGTATFSGFTATAPANDSLRRAGAVLDLEVRPRATGVGSPVTASTTFMVGDGQAENFGATPVFFTGNLGTLSLPNLFGSNDGLYWDTDTFNVSSVVGPGNSSDTATISVAGDCLLWSAQAFSVTVTPAQAPPPVTATAAVVQANVNGNTVVNQRGLAPADAPTLQEQILMIVQNQIIQNPSMNPQVLTSQLVNSLPPSILPPNEAASIVNNVLNNIIPPKITPTITWAAPAAIAFGSALGSLQLDATASVPGRFVYMPPAGTVLPVGNGQTLTAAFTPADLVHYTTATATTMINVRPGAASPAPASLVVTNVLIRNAGNVTIQLTIANAGGTAASNAVLTTVKVGATAAAPLPQMLGPIAPGAFVQATVTVPGSVGASGAASSLSVSGTYTGGTFSSNSRITLP